MKDTPTCDNGGEVGSINATAELLCSGRRRESIAVVVGSPEKPGHGRSARLDSIWIHGKKGQGMGNAEIISIQKTGEWEMQRIIWIQACTHTSFLIPIHTYIYIHTYIMIHTYIHTERYCTLQITTIFIPFQGLATSTCIRKRACECPNHKP